MLTGRRWRSSFARPAAALLAAFGVGALAAACGATGDEIPGTGAPVLLVSAPASLSDAIGAVADAFERETGGRILLNAAGSHVLAAQILEGAPVDVFISADVRQMDRVLAAGWIDAASRVDLLSNRLVGVVPVDRKGSITGPEALARDTVRRIALGDPEAVPAGVYARRYLESIGLWEAVADKVAPAGSVRAALRAVESGAVDAGIVYRTDALTSTGVAVAFEVPRADGPSIVYPAALAAGTPNPNVARRFLDYLRGDVAARLFEAAGFVLLEPAAGSKPS